jgi:hypothetical protein
VKAWYETKTGRISLVISNSYAYKGSRLYELDVSDPSKISFSETTSSQPISITKSQRTEFGLTDENVLERMKSSFKNQRISYFSKTETFQKYNLTFIATDAGLHIYNSKTGVLLTFIKNFYTGNDVE